MPRPVVCYCRAGWPLEQLLSQVWWRLVQQGGALHAGGGPQHPTRPGTTGGVPPG
jgi:hypothetical protein